MKKTTITFNNKEYKIPNFDFNALCELGDRGLDTQDLMSGKLNGLKLIRAILSFTINESVETTGNLITKYISENGMENFNEVIKPLIEAFGNSDFFKSLVK